MKKSLLNICFCLFCWCMSAQQNLVPNGSFEDTLSCPTSFDELYKANHWYKPSQGSPDYFNQCCSNLLTVGVPVNGAGYQLAKDGLAYAGFSVGFDTNFILKNYREYLQVKLSRKLTPSKLHHVQFYISRSDSFFVALKNIGLYFSSNSISCNCSTTLLYSPQINYNNFITDNTNWTLIEGDYLSNGTEEYLTIGYFKDNNSNDTLKLDNRPDSLMPATSFNNYAYYYVDDVSLTEATVNIQIPNIFTPNADGSNDVFHFNVDIIKAKSLTIYNRWGNKVFDSKNNFSWDGRTTSGEPSNAGTYYYIIQTETENYKGFIQLLR